MVKPERSPYGNLVFLDQLQLHCIACRLGRSKYSSGLCDSCSKKRQECEAEIVNWLSKDKSRGTS